MSTNAERSNDELEDELEKLFQYGFPRILKFLHTLGRIEQLLLSVKELTMSTNTGMQRLQDDSDAMQAQLTTIQTSLKTMSDALVAANIRMENDLAALRGAAGSGNADAINAVATKLETTLGALKTIQAQMDATATAEGTLDQPVTSTALTVSPTTAQVAPGGTQQFSASTSVTWKANNGTIDTNGLYTAPTTGQTADVITATGVADTTQTATAQITIG